MSYSRDPVTLRICLGLIRVFGRIVPSRARAEWSAEWEAEVRHRWHSLERGEQLDWRARMDLLRRAVGAFPDATWLRRQFTADAEILQDVRHGVRMLRKSPAFTLSAVFILALGIGGTVAITALLDTLVVRPLPYADAEQIVTVWQRHAARPAERGDVAPADFLDWRERATSFSAIAALAPMGYDYTGGGEPEVFFGAQVTEGFFDAIGMTPLLGRAFTPEEHLPGGAKSAVITFGLWQSRFGADPSIINRSISLDGTLWTIVGVLPREFAPQMLPRPGELAVWTPKIVQDHEKRTRASAWWNAVARLRPGVTLAQAQGEMDAISADLAREYPRTNASTSAVLVSLRDHLMGGVRVPLFILLGAVVLVLAIGCANVASLLLARGIERSREFAIRSALGAGRGRLVRQMVVESLLLSLVAAAVGVLLARWTLSAIVALAPAGLLRLQEASIDSRMLVVAAGLTALTTVAFGLLPALQYSRPGTESIRERHAEAPRGGVRRGLVMAEVAIALVLLTGAGLLVRSFERLLSVDPGFSPRDVVSVQLFAWDRHGAPDRLRNFFASTIERMESQPGVAHAGAVSAMPFAASNINIQGTYEIVGRPAPAKGEERRTHITIATPGYFPAMSIPLREGRFLESRDTQTAPTVTVISESLRRAEWPTESPVGRRLRVQWQGRPLEVEIVGVVSQIRHDGLDSAPRDEIFLPLAQVPFGSMTYVVRGAGGPASLIETAKRQIWSIDSMQTIYDTASLEALVDASVVRQRFSMTLMSSLAIVALVLCASGIYGIISFTTAQRTREIGVRMALGADRSVIRRMVLFEGSGVVLVGLAAGLVGALGAARLLQSLLFEVPPGDPLTIGAVCLLLGCVGLAACYVPARRATRIDPIVALRVE